MGSQQTRLAAGVPYSKFCCGETCCGPRGFRASRRSGEERTTLEHLLRHDGMVLLYLTALFARWTAEPGLPSRAGIALGKKQGRVKHFPGKASDVAAGV